MPAIRHTLEVVVEHRQRLQTLDETVRIIVEDDTLVQQSFGVEDGLQFLHYLISLLPPFVFHERCHIAARTMLCLQRTVVFLDNELGHITHHLCIAVHLSFLSETLIQNKVIVTLEGMTIDTGIVIAVISNEFLKLYRCLRQALDGEGNILNEA